MATDGTDDVYRSTLLFTGLRLAEAALVAVIIAWAAAIGPTWQATVGAVVGALIVLVALVRLIRSRLIVSADTVTVLGSFKDRHLPVTSVVAAVARPTWYSWKRVACPVALFLRTRDGSEIRVGAVQSMIWNVGIVRPSLDAEVARSHPQRVADELNRRLSSSA